MGRPGGQTIPLRGFPGFVVNPEAKDAGELASEHLHNVISIDPSRGRTRRGLDLHNVDDYDSGSGISIRVEAPPAGVVGALVPVPAFSAGNLVGLFCYTPRSAYRYPGFSAASPDAVAYLELWDSAAGTGQAGLMVVDLTGESAAPLLVSHSAGGHLIAVSKGTDNRGYWATFPTAGICFFGRTENDNSALIESLWNPSLQAADARNVFTAFGLAGEDMLILIADFSNA